MKLTLAAHVAVTETEHGVVLLDERQGRYWQMNETGATVLRCLRDGGTPQSAVALLCERLPDTPADRERVAEDVHRLVAALRAAELVS
ncbi:lasso peptide biosynthesis PqqD family chaperone [Streptomyces sp. JH002]|uniref:lasso peptide biosynthesis PqqD family chaperone n=1 Tax=Streptomyces TaxID=1883 RepID=UPI0036D08C52